MDVLLLGGTGQLGEELRAPWMRDGLRMNAPSRHELDLTSEADIAQWIAAKPWSAVVNAAAYTEVDRAESESAMAYALNATAP
jgi:dTDP-4-dehydrorhamnose reductase